MMIGNLVRYRVEKLDKLKAQLLRLAFDQEHFEKMQVFVVAREEKEKNGKPLYVIKPVKRKPFKIMDNEFHARPDEVEECVDVEIEVKLNEAMKPHGK